MTPEPTIFILLTNLELAQDQLYRAKFIEDYKRFEFEEHRAKVRIKGLTERIRTVDLFALPPKDTNGDGNNG